MVYNTVHTGPNNQLGGCHDGFFIVGNQEATSFLCPMPMTIPAPKGMAMLTASDRLLPISHIKIHIKYEIYISALT